MWPPLNLDGRVMHAVSAPVVDDFLDCVPLASLPLCVACVAAFGRQHTDMNVSLTAVGMLWTVVDFVSHHRGGGGGGDGSDESSDGSGGGGKENEAECEMGGWTRLLHSGEADDLMDELPTFLADPLPESVVPHAW